jgi:hypothetical protein
MSAGKLSLSISAVSARLRADTAEGVDFSTDPHGNHGDIQTSTSAGGVL